MAEDGRAERDQSKRATSYNRTAGVLAGGPTSDPAMAQADARPATRPGWKHTLDSLENRDFRYLWLGMLTLMGGMQMQTLARGYLAYDITSSPLILGVVNAGFALPMLGLSLFGGAVADRVERKRVIQTAQIVEGMAALFIAISIITNTVSWYHLLASSMIHGATFSFMMPARQAIIPQLVGKKMVTNAIALNATAMALTTLVAPAVAGTLYALIGPDGVYFVVAGLGLCAVLFTAMISSKGSVASPSKAPVLDDIVAGLSYVRRSPLALILLSMGLATALLAMPFRFLMPVFVVDIYHRGPEALGLMVSVMGAGSLVGALLIASLGRWLRASYPASGSSPSTSGARRPSASWPFSCWDTQPSSLPPKGACGMSSRDPSAI